MECGVWFVVFSVLEVFLVRRLSLVECCSLVRDCCSLCGVCCLLCVV